MTSAPTTDREFSTAEFFALAKTRLSLDVPRELTDPCVVPRIDHPDVDPEVIAAIAATESMQAAAVLVPEIARAKPTVLLTQRTAHLADHNGQIAFPGGKILRSHMSHGLRGAPVREILWIDRRKVRMSKFASLGIGRMRPEWLRRVTLAV